MGGKQKQAQRTKNNARPSSSGRSAELLGSAIPPFVGFSGVKEGSFVPLLPNWNLMSNLSEDADNIDGNFQIVLKKMSKKDATTKLKALQEFTAMISESNLEAVKAILPFWPRLYCHLATDVEHRVREAAQAAQGAVALKVKRNLAPYLKQLAPVWLIAQYDTYPPAASMATQSFQQAFPTNKLPEVMLFCQEEVLSYICDNLTVHTAQTLSNPKTTTPEHAEAKYERVLISSLLGYSFYLKTMSSEHLKTPHNLNTKIVTSSRFWKLVKHKSSSIRSSWYKVLSALCSYAPILLEAEAGHLTCAVMANLDENDPAVLPAVWEAALLALSTVKEWWTHISVEKVVLPILWRVLKAGGQGCASSIYPHLLPLLAHFPPGQDPLQFYTNFFDNMRIGLSNKTVLTSRSELNAVSSAIIECMKYTILKNQTNSELCLSILSKQLLPLIEWTIINCQTSSKIIFKQTSSLIRYWNRNVCKQEYPLYSVLMQTYWADINNLMKKVFTSFDSEYDANTREKACENILELILSLRSDKLSKTRSNLKVTFTESDMNMINADDSVLNSAQDIYFNQNLNALVYNLLRLLIIQINKVQTNQYIGYFCHLVQEFKSEELFKSLLTREYSNSLFEFYKEILLMWLNTESICTKELVSICFVLFKYLSKDEKMYFLCSLTQVSTTGVMSWSVSCCLSHPLCDDLVVQEWLKKHDVSALLMNITNKIISNNELSDNMTILKQCFMHNEDILISEQTSADIINLICTSLQKESATLDTCASFASQISTILYSDSCRFTCDNTLVCGLFSLALRFKGCNEYFSADTLWEVNSAWQDAVSYIAKDKNNLLILARNCALIITNLLLCETLDTQFLQVMGNAVISFIKSALENSDNNMELDEKILMTCNLLNIFFNTSSKKIETYRSELFTLNLNADLVKGKLSVFSENESDDIQNYFLKNDQISDIKFVSNFFVQTYFIIQVMTKLLKENDIEENSDLENDEENEETNLFLCTDKKYVQDQVVQLIYDAVLLEHLVKNYKNTELCQEVLALPFYSFYKENLINLIDAVDLESRNVIENKLCQAARTKALYWTQAIYYFERELKCKSPNSIEFDVEKLYKKVLCKDNLDSTDIGWIHVTQIFENLPAECISVKFDGHNDAWLKFRWNQTIAARCMLQSESRDEYDTRPFEIMHVLLNKNKLESNTLLYNRNIGNIPWSSVMLVSELARLMALVVSKSYSILSEDQWDGIRLALSNWVLSVAKSRQEIQQLKIKIFISSIFELFASIVNVTNLSIPEIEPLKQEWNDVFSKEVNLVLIKSWMIMLDSIKHQPEYYTNNITFVQNLNSTISYIDYSHIFIANKIDAKTSLNDLLELSLKLIQSQNVEIQYSAQLVLKSLATFLVKKDDEALHNSPEESNNPLIFNKFEESLKELDDLIKILLVDFKLCEESCVVKPNTDSYFITFSYLLLCDIILHYCKIASSSLRLQYASWLSSREYIKSMLENILRLMPHQIFQCLDLKMPLYQKMFSTSFDSRENSSTVLEHLACYIYCNTLRLLPALARQWWNSSESRVSNIIDKVTTTYISPLICKEEIEAVQNHQTKDEHMQVKVNAAYEVLAIYTVDEVNMEILISLPYNYPLGPVKVMSRKEICGTAQWRTWVRQLTLFLTHQNGNIWDGLTQWKSNLDKRFDGVEECYVCYSVVHASTHQLPKSTCKTCRKKFHSQCLYKWFNTSNKSTCPICRNMF